MTNEVTTVTPRRVRSIGTTQRPIYLRREWRMDAPEQVDSAALLAKARNGRVQALNMCKFPRRPKDVTPVDTAWTSEKLRTRIGAIMAPQFTGALIPAE